MNALIPALILVFLAEFGGTLSRLVMPVRLGIVAAVVGTFAFAALSALALAPMLSTWARLLMFGLAAVFAAAAQVGTARRSGIGTALWRSPTPFLIFTLALLAGEPLMAPAGGLIGLAGANAAHQIVPGHAAVLVRRAFAVALALTGIIAGLNGLRLV